MIRKRAQAWGFDLMVGVSIFLVGMIVFFLYALNLPSENDEIISLLSYEGRLVGDSLLSDGFPINWDENNVVTIGLLSEGTVNETKLRLFNDLYINNSAKSKSVFNIRNNYYVYFDMSVKDDRGNSIIGIGDVPTGSNSIVRTSRVVVYNNSIVNLNINIWK